MRQNILSLVFLFTFILYSSDYFWKVEGGYAMSGSNPKLTETSLNQLEGFGILLSTDESNHYINSMHSKVSLKFVRRLKEVN